MIYCRYLQFRFLKWPLLKGWIGNDPQGEARCLRCLGGHMLYGHGIASANGQLIEPKDIYHGPSCSVPIWWCLSPRRPEILNIFRIIFEYSTIHCVPNIDPYLPWRQSKRWSDDPCLHPDFFFSKLEEPQKGFDRLSLRCLGSRPVLSNG